MTKIIFIDSNETRTEINSSKGTSVMQAAVDNDIDGIVAECGGVCACATCHCYIDTAWFDKLGKPDDIELHMLSYVAAERRPESRLACQLLINDEFEGLVVTTPEEQ